MKTEIPIILTTSDDREEHHHRTYDVTIIDDCPIQTIVTRSASVASNWLRETISIINNRSNIVIGLSVYWRPCFIPDTRCPVAIISLCLDNRCLIYQILQRATIDRWEDLKSFLAGSNYTFVGEDVCGIIVTLFADYVLKVQRMVDLNELGRTLANDKLESGANVTKLAEVFLNQDIYKPVWIETSDWDRELLSMEQVKYAVYDAYLCCKVGIVTEAYKYEPFKIFDT